MQAASDIVRTGYRRIVQFIRMAEARVTYGTWNEPFNNRNFKAIIKYNGTLHLQLPDGNFIFVFFKLI